MKTWSTLGQQGHVEPLHIRDPHTEDRADKHSCVVSFIVLGSLKDSLWPHLAPAAGRGNVECGKGVSVCSAVFD